MLDAVVSGFRTNVTVRIENLCIMHLSAKFFIAIGVRTI